MLNVHQKYLRRVVFVSKLFPKLKSPLRFSDFQTDVDVRSKNRDLLTFFGCISDAIGANTFAQLPTFRRSLKKLINIVEFELTKIGAQEVLLPTIIPQRLWRKSERIARHPRSLDNLFKMTDNDKRELILGPTFEESVTHIMAHIDGVIHEHDLPILLYQSSPKFRQESNPKFGIIRSNEFFMNDLYSFDSDLKTASITYQKITQVYNNIFERLGLNCITTANDPGNIGGLYSHEYQMPVQSGQDQVMKCDNCNTASNFEIVKFEAVLTCPNCDSRNVNVFSTIELGHTFLLSDLYSKPMKAKFSSLGQDLKNFEMGCYGLGLSRIIGAGVDLLSITSSVDSDKNLSNLVQIRWPRNIEPFYLGIVLPAKRSKQHQTGSTEFVERLLPSLLDLDYEIDVLIEDRDKGIGQRLVRLQSLGLPYIIVIGKGYLQDPPEIELHELDENRRNYRCYSFSEDQLFDFMRNKASFS